MNPSRFLLLGAACLLSLAASAQWQWIDNAGRKVFSDRAPPTDILEKNILKRPVARSPKTEKSDLPSNTALTAPASAPTTSLPQDAASAPKLSGVDKELADKKKKANEAEAAKRKLEQENNLKAGIENCARAKQAKASYESGMRVARMNEKGEREIVDDAMRGAELKRLQAIINSDCQ
jgi:hypothetical protein